MRKSILLLSVLCIAASCGKNGAKVAGTIEGANGKDIVISKLDINAITPVDTIKTDNNGNFNYKFKLSDESPQFYYVSYNRKRVASLIVKPSDKIKIKTDTSGVNTFIEGSEDSRILKSLDSTFSESVNKFDALTFALLNANSINDTATSRSIRRELGRLYVKQKQSAIKSILTHPYSFSNISALYQNFENNLPVFAEFTDGLLFKRVYDSLITLYPKSAYVKLLKKEVDAFDANAAFNARLENASEQIYPEINLPDVNAQMQSLKSLQGNPFILYFWTAQDVNQKLFNRELAELYNKYKSKGLEIYQVSTDIDKVMWATAVKEQELSWINVCDGKGGASPAVTAYNITKIPTLFIFDKAGNIVSKNEFREVQLENIIDKICNK